MAAGGVDSQDRARWERQVAALVSHESDDEGSLEWRAALHEWMDAERRAIGQGALKTEGELHRRAQACGLLRRVP